jgi:uncharacterized membrane protein YdjX (TVP38/TMEM64 family)
MPASERPAASAAPPAARSRGRAKLALVALVVLGLLAAWRAGLLALFADPARVRLALIELGPWGYLAFVGAYTALQPFGVPGTVFVFAAPLVWPWPVAFALSMAGTMGASVVGFSFTRFMGRDWVAARIPARFRAYDEALAKRGFATVAALRFVFWMPQPLHAFFGLSNVSFWTHFWGSVVGYAVPLLVVSFFGERAFEALRAVPPSVWAWGGGAVVVIGGTVLLVRRSRRGGAR